MHSKKIAPKPDRVLGMLWPPMKVTAYQVSAHIVTVVPHGEPGPRDYLAVMDVDTGVGTGWRFAVEYAKARMKESFVVVSPTRAVRVEKHSCHAPSVMVNGKRYDPNGVRHRCRKKSVVEEEKGLFDE